MNVTLACPKCERAVRVELESDRADLACPACKSTIRVPSGSIVGGRLEQCIVCRSRDIYARKDFPQRLGVLIVGLGFAASCVTWAYSLPLWTFAILFATALVDVVLYVIMPAAVVCYHCGAAYRGIANMDRYAGFELDTHERHRQQRIRIAEHEQPARARERGNDTSTKSQFHESPPGGGTPARDRVQ
jgi:hypothetical protein